MILPANKYTISEAFSIFTGKAPRTDAQKTRDSERAEASILFDRESAKAPKGRAAYWECRAYMDALYARHAERLREIEARYEQLTEVQGDPLLKRRRAA